MRKPIFVVLLIVFVSLTGFIQHELNHDREKLGLTRTDVLQNAPPVLAFTTVALGGFRGLIANALWIRANELQEDGKYFEMVQLADWITKLQPHFTQVWVNLAWNLAYNISVKFPNPHDRWLWVQRGIELLRDQGLKYNPHEVLMYRELAWFYQHKMGAYLDDAHITYKAEWAREMQSALGGGRPDYERWLDPKNTNDLARLTLLKEKYKLEIPEMKAVDDRYGPLEWRLPESHAIYWASVGLKRAKLSDKPEAQLITLRRAVYQPLLTAFQRGRFITNRMVVEGQLKASIEFGPNLNMVTNVSKAYEQAMNDDAEMRDHIGNAHKNFIRDAVYFMFAYNREREARQWFKYGSERYGTNAFGGIETMEKYALSRITEDVNETSPDRVRAMLEGMLSQSYYNLTQGEDDQAEGLDRMARLVYNNFAARTSNKSSAVRMPLPSIAEIKKNVLDRMLSPAEGMHPELRLQLRTRLGMPAETPDEKKENP